MRAHVYRLMFVLLAAAACSADTGLTSPSEERDVVADRLAQLADSISLESDEAAAEPYRELSDLVRRTDHPSIVRLSVDGEPLPFSAVAHETLVTAPCSEPSSGTDAAPCTRTSRLRALLAWHAPTRRLLLLTTSTERGSLEMPNRVAGSVASAPTAQLRFFDQSGRWSWATSGAYASNVKTEGECAVARRLDGERALAKCLVAQFQWQFEATTTRRDDTREAADAPTVITHTLRLPASAVDGTQWTLSAPPPPPAPPSASPLVANLRTRVDSVVALALVVRNESEAPVTLRFSSGQQYDFEIRDRSGKKVWRWSDDRAFIAALTSRTIPAHESVTFDARWVPTAHGELIVVATMTSTTQLVSARAALTVP